MRRIIYAIDEDTGLVCSRVGSEIAYPILDYVKIGQDGDFSGPLNYYLEKFSVLELAETSAYARLRWTRQLPIEVKNIHRAFWGMPLLKETV